MNIILILVMCHLILIQIIDSKIFKGIPGEELLSYEIDKSVIDNHKTYFDFSNVVFELIDDDMIHVGGYLKSIKSMDPKLPVQAAVQTQYLNQSTWVKGPMYFQMPNTCPELLNTSQFWYNITKLWTKCPPQEEDIWPIEDHIFGMQINLSHSMPVAKYKFFALFTQGLTGSETTKFGLAFPIELVAIQ